MISRGIQAFAGKRVLLLQGPVGPFFARLASDLRAANATVFKVNFNAGDWIYYRHDAFNYRGTEADWPAWLSELLDRLHIDTVMLFGDCRPVHVAAHAVASQRGLSIGVFEEGYVRPNYITLESVGVNGNSRLERIAENYKEEPLPMPKPLSVGKTYWPMAWYAFSYFTVALFGRYWFRFYLHHRPVKFVQAFPWLRSVWRKQHYRWTERDVHAQLTDEWSDQYFLVPLQVFNDAQLLRHADFKTIEHFIEMTLRSFARDAPAGTMLVFKHHPMDRGYRDYSVLIRTLATEVGMPDRILYIHDQHLPTMLFHARGVVVINSTVGLSALHHGAATKVCGTALYNIPGLTFQGALGEFWRAASEAKPDRKLYRRFVAHLVARTQLNGSFYRPLKVAGSQAGLMWSASPARPNPALPTKPLPAK